MSARPGGALPSGAIGGVMEADAVLFPRALPCMSLSIFGFYITRIVVPAFLMLGYWLIIQLLGGIPTLVGASGGIAFWAHVGGFIAGVILARMLCNPQRAEACLDRKGLTERMVQRYRTP